METEVQGQVEPETWPKIKQHADGWSVSHPNGTIQTVAWQDVMRIALGEVALTHLILQLAEGKHADLNKPKSD